MSDHQMEVLLRPPVELWPGTVSISCGIVCLIAPSMLMMAETIGYGSGAVLIAFGLHRFRQGYAVLRYQKNLKKLSRFQMSAKQIPCYKSYLYLGKGFKWEQKHTQRLKDTLSPQSRKYIRPSPMYDAVRKFERASERGPLSPIANLTSKDSPLNPFRPLPPIGGIPAIHGVEPKEVDVLLPLTERVGHTLVMGTTRVGKTRLAEILIEQDIKRCEGPVIVFDPKSDAGLLSRMYLAAKRAGRLDDFYIFHLGFPEISARYNAVGNYARITEVAGRISGQLSAEGNSAAFKEFAWRFINIVARALNSLGIRPDYNNILRYVTDIEPLFIQYMDWWLPRNAPSAWVADVNDYTADAEKEAAKNPRFKKHAESRTEGIKRYLEKMGPSDPIVLGLLSALRYDKTYFDKLVASLLPLLEKLTTGQIGKLIAPDYFDASDDRPIFDWMQVIRKRGIVYVGLDAMTDTEVSGAVGNSMFSDLVANSGLIYKHGTELGMLEGRETVMPKICLHADEINELMGDEFLPMVNKSGGAGMQITAYTQSSGDIEAKMGSTAKARQVEGNFNNLIMLRVKEVQTAELLTTLLPEVEISQKMTVSGAADSSDVDNSIDFTSNTQDRISALRVPMLETAHITSLPKGQAFCLLEGGHLWKVRFPLPVEEKDEIPATLQELTREMEKNYHTSEQWWL
ncbi:type IV conjugative transfer system coupling protein TraD [Zhongshania marina]|uniref:Conjugative coupling factor TraD, PFGI-1 class n=1 Tax=Zhongshania marina TaxID=2304603 RepID=A0A2S4HC33_9GAMM|nr:type IV conjugative transfer system coupling protein TraD [Marortus luteolus]POP51566.1 conjugative coupling factor TraD, PFGI-1 class [Marortus luteolus]